MLVLESTVTSLLRSPTFDDDQAIQKHKGDGLVRADVQMYGAAASSNQPRGHPSIHC